MQSAAPPERQSNADFFTQPAVQMQWLMFIYSPVVNVQISALSLSSIKLVFSVHPLVSPGTPGLQFYTDFQSEFKTASGLLLAGADLSPRVVNVLSAP